MECWKFVQRTCKLLDLPIESKFDGSLLYCTDPAWAAADHRRAMAQQHHRPAAEAQSCGRQDLRIRRRNGGSAEPLFSHQQKDIAAAALAAFCSLYASEECHGTYGSLLASPHAPLLLRQAAPAISAAVKRLQPLEYDAGVALRHMLLEVFAGASRAQADAARALLPAISYVVSDAADALQQSSAKAAAAAAADAAQLLQEVSQLQAAGVHLTTPICSPRLFV